MTFRQIEYFLEVAKCNNISDAAENLFVTQPTLGRQMSALEAELNMQLFMRSNKGTKLTPAGVIMFQELSGIMDSFNSAVKKGRMASYGYSGSLKVGILSGLDIQGPIQDLILHMSKEYPNIRLELGHFSHGALVQGLAHGELDVAFSLDLAFVGAQNLRILNIESCKPAFFVSETHPLAQKDRIRYADLKGQQLVIVKKGDCPAGEQLIIEECRKYGDFYPEFYYAETMENAILWVAAGLKCAIFNSKMTLVQSPDLRCMMIEEQADITNYIQAAWHKDNSNVALNFALDYLGH